jgi:fatty acid desaturase
MSYRRKFLRDITGQTGYQQRKAQLLNALGPKDWPLKQRAAHFWEKLGPQFAVNAVMFAGLAAAGVWWAYPVLWLLPLVTWMMVITRIRNVAEHAVVPDSADPLRNTRTTHANLLERLFIAPHYVNHHLEHHLLFYVPCITCRGSTAFSARAGMPGAWRCSRTTPPCCGWRRRNRTRRTGRGNW